MSTSYLEIFLTSKHAIEGCLIDKRQENSRLNKKAYLRKAITFVHHIKVSHFLCSLV